jgi:hypothetical protein
MQWWLQTFGVPIRGGGQGVAPLPTDFRHAGRHLGVSIIRRKRLRRGLFGLPVWFFDCGRRSAARKATGLRWRFGPQAREVLPKSAPLRVAGENFTPGPCTPRTFYRRKSPDQKAEKNRR